MTVPFYNQSVLAKPCKHDVCEDMQVNPSIKQWPSPYWRTFTSCFTIFGVCNDVLTKLILVQSKMFVVKHIPSVWLNCLIDLILLPNRNWWNHMTWWVSLKISFCVIKELLQRDTLQHQDLKHKTGLLCLKKVSWISHSNDVT